jgi:hypothetical protein
MLKNAVRWAFILLALLLIGPIMGRLIGSLHALDGSHHATPLASSTPLKGLGLLLLVSGVATGFGVFMSRIYGLANGMNVAGLIFAWCAWNTGTIDALARSAGHKSPLASMAVEGLIVAVVACVGALLLQRESLQARQDRTLRISVKDMLGRTALVSIVAAIVAGAALGWFVANDTLKGQAVFAAIAAGIAAGAAAQLSSAQNTAAVVPAAMLGVGVLAALGPICGMILHGSRFVAAASSGSVFSLAVPVPLDWIAGAYLGVPIGIQWAGSMIEKRLSQPA